MSHYFKYKRAVYALILIVLLTSCQSRIKRIFGICDIEVPSQITVTRDEYQDMWQDYAYYYNFTLSKEACDELTASIRGSCFFNPNISEDSVLTQREYIKSNGIRALWIRTKKGYRFVSNDDRRIYSAEIDTLKGCAEFIESSD